MSDPKNTGRGVQPPYVSKTVLNAFFQKMQNVSRPKVLTPAVLKEYDFSQVGALQSALKFLGLIDDKGNTTEKFQQIQVTGQTFQKNLKEIILTAYKDLLDKHPLNNATYDGILNYLAHKYSPATKYKMAKAFGVLCQMAGLESPAFTKMRSMDGTDAKPRVAASSSRHTGKAPKTERPSKSERPPAQPPSGSEDLVKEYIKANPMPTGVQWDSNTLKAYFEQYRATLEMLRGTKKEGE